MPELQTGVCGEAGCGRHHAVGADVNRTQRLVLDCLSHTVIPGDPIATTKARVEVNKEHRMTTIDNLPNPKKHMSSIQRFIVHSPLVAVRSIGGRKLVTLEKRTDKPRSRDFTHARRRLKFPVHAVDVLPEAQLLLHREQTSWMFAHSPIPRFMSPHGIGFHPRSRS